MDAQSTVPFLYCALLSARVCVVCVCVCAHVYMYNSSSPLQLIGPPNMLHITAQQYN